MAFKNLNGLEKPHYLIQAWNWLDQADAELKEMEARMDHGYTIDPCVYQPLHDQYDRADAYVHQMYERWEASKRPAPVKIALPANVNNSEVEF